MYVLLFMHTEIHTHERERERGREGEGAREGKRAGEQGRGLADTHDFHDTKFVEIITKLVRTRAQNEQHRQRPALDLSGFRCCQGLGDMSPGLGVWV